MNEVRALFLDVGWTLSYPEQSIWQIISDLCRQAGADATPEQSEELLYQLRESVSSHAEEQFRSGADYSDSDEDFSLMFDRMTAPIFGHFGITEGQQGLMAEFFQRFWNEENWKIFPEVLDFLDRVRSRGVRVGVVSNAPTSLTKFLDRLAITPLLDFAVISAAHGVKKPDPRIFRIALDQAGVEASQALHVGDMYLEDVLGASALGISTALIRRGKNSLFPSFPEAPTKVSTQSVVPDLNDLESRFF